MCDCELCLIPTDETFLTTDGAYACPECYFIHDGVDGFEDPTDPDET